MNRPWLTACIVLLGTLAVPALAQETAWVRQFGTSQDDEVNATAPDGTGGAFVAGRTRGDLAATFAGVVDGFIARFDEHGTSLWTRQLGTAQFDEAVSLASDGVGGAFVSGTTQGALGGPISGAITVFLARYDDAGTQLWITQFNEAAPYWVGGITPDGSGGVFMTGYTVQGVQNFTAAFIARFDSDGNEIWLETLPDDGRHESKAITPDGAGGIIIAGSASNLPAVIVDEIAFLARYDGSGNRIWFNYYGTTGDDEFLGVAPDTGGHFIAGGNTLEDPADPNGQDRDLWVLKFDLDGNEIWSKTFGSTEFDELTDVCTNGNGGVFIVGITSGNIASNSNNNDECDGVILAIDGNGNQTWARQYGTSVDHTQEELLAVSTDGFGGAFFGGTSDGNLFRAREGRHDAIIGRIMQDSDQDGLLDDWEINGIPYQSESGFILRVPLPGADPLHKDLYVEVDARSGNQISAAAVGMLQTAYANSPVPNPDGINGINLHVQIDDSAVPLPAVWTVAPCFPPDFETFRFAWYGTAGERAAASSVALLEAKSKAYRYCLAGNDSGPKRIGGCGQRPGDNFVIFINNYTPEQQAAVFMHELGHNLGLGHGGGDGINGKPNYPSVMNYVLSYRSNWNKDFWRLDYSHAEAGQFVTLNEGFLFETLGVGTPAGMYRDFWMPFGVTQEDETNSEFRDFGWVQINGSPVDFGSPEGDGWPNGSKLDAGAIQDLNYVASGTGIPSGIPSTPSPFQILEPHDDWGNIGLTLAAAKGAAANAAEYPDDELTEEGREWIADNFDSRPPNICNADTNGDGILDLGDIQTFITLFLNGNIAADFNDDGILDLGDIQAFISQFLAGCV